MAIGEDGVIYLTVLWENKLYAINPDGTKKRSFTLNDKTPSYPVVGEDGTIYVATVDRLYTINPDGTERWSWQTEGRPWVPLVGKDDTLFMSDGLKLYIFDPDGTIKLVIDSPYEPGLITEDGTIYATVAKTKKIFAFNQDGEEKWSCDVGFDAGLLIIDEEGMLFFVSEDFKIYVIDRQEGVLKKIIGVNDAPKLEKGFRYVMGKDRTLYLAQSEGYGGYLYAVTLEGQIKWHFNLKDIPTTPIISANGTIYIGAGVYDVSAYTKLYAFNPDGTVKWCYRFDESPISKSAIGPDGTIYVGVRNKLYAFEDDGGGLATDAPWPKFRADYRNTGRYKGHQTTP